MTAAEGATYAAAGVDIAAGDEAVERIKGVVASTTRPGVLGGIGGFGGLFALDTERYRSPVLVAATDGVGTKLEVARLAGRYETVGIDLVAMCVDDLICVGAEPLFMLDYVAVGAVDPDRIAEVVGGIARLLRPGGILLVAVPNFASPEARIGRAGWFHLDVPRHLVHFTPSTLTAMLRTAGFRPVKVGYLVPEYDLFSFVQTVENRLGLPPNLLYDVLRRPEARLKRQQSGRLAAAVAVGLAAPLSVAAVVMAPIAAAARRSATIVVYAERTSAQRE